MKNTRFIFPLFLALILINSTFAQSRFYGTVTEIVDGRTLIVEPQPQVKIKIQLQFIEVPEEEQKLHSVVKKHLTNLVLNKVVEFKPKNINETAKPVGQILLGGVDISQQMLRDGAAWYSSEEKDIQSSFEIELYKKNEALAKNEKRGVWSIPDLKPAWEFRAEKAKKAEKKLQEEIKKREEEQKRLVESQKTKKRTKNQRLTAEERQQANENVQMWADVSSYDFIVKYADLFDKSDKANLNEPIANFDSVNQRGYVATRLSFLNLSNKSGDHKVFAMVVYTYWKDDGKSDNNYVFAIVSESPDEKFAEASDLTALVDETKIHSNGSKRMVKKTPSGGVQETLLYRIKKEDLTTVKKAKNVKVTLGNYKGEASGSFLEKIQTLLKKLD